MSPSKPSKKKASKARPKKAKAKKAKSARRAKAAPKKAARKPLRNSGRSAPVVFRRKGGESGAGDTVDTLGEWQHDHEVDTEKYTEDDIPPDYGGSE